MSQTNVKNHDLKPELVFYAGNKLLEGPLWDEDNERLYFISIEDEIIYQFDEKTTEVTSYKTDGPVGCVILDKDGLLLSAEKSGIYSINPETKSRSFEMQPNQDERLRYNDGKADPNGRFFVGTMGYEEVIEGAASLYVIENGETKELLRDLTIANGLGWSGDGKAFYHIDSPTKKVRQYDYDLKTAEISNERVIIKITDDSIPDGMCVDTDGNLWIAEFGGKKICKWDPKTGEKLIQIDMPVSNVTSCCLGGPDKEYLYITTAKEDDEPLSGGLFRVKLR